MSDYKTEVTTRFAKCGFKDLSEAWVFVMNHIDKVGPDPEIKITPTWLVTRDEKEPPRTFTAVVSGMVEED